MEGHTFSADQKVNAVVEAYLHACFQLQFVPSLVLHFGFQQPIRCCLHCPTGNDLYRICIRVGSV